MTHQSPPPSGEPADSETRKPPSATEIIYRRLFEADQSPGKSVDAMPQGEETILLVDDTSWFRELIRRNLQSWGYTVLEAARGEEAIQVAREYPGVIHLLAADLGLPGIRGRRLAESIRALQAGIKQLYISGYSLDALLRHGLLEANAPFLQKPFPPHALATKVREVLDQ